MNSRERILAAINHREPDKVPIDLGATPSSGISAIAYSKLIKQLGRRQGTTQIYDVVQQLAQPEDVILDLFGIDVLDIGRTSNTEPTDWYPITLSNGEPAQDPQWFHPQLANDGSWNVYHADGTQIAKMPLGATFFDQTCFPYLNGYPNHFKDLPRAMEKVLWSAIIHNP